MSTRTVVILLALGALAVFVVAYETKTSAPPPASAPTGAAAASSAVPTTIGVIATRTATPAMRAGLFQLRSSTIITA